MPREQNASFAARFARRASFRACDGVMEGTARILHGGLPSGSPAYVFTLTELAPLRHRNMSTAMRCFLKRHGHILETLRSKSWRAFVRESVQGRSARSLPASAVSRSPSRTSLRGQSNNNPGRVAANSSSAPQRGQLYCSSQITRSPQRNLMSASSNSSPDAPLNHRVTRPIGVTSGDPHFAQRTGVRLIFDETRARH